MPFINVKILEKRIDPQHKDLLIAKLTDAVVETYGEEIRDHVWIVLEPIPAERWGIGGKPVS
ncbi:4-oxalocrotonate tautomerase family protein [Nocardia sp. NPDC020380]|jgi:4-oxalocrotonate tautomerase|uniref:tautomerase family protein n=1 Tax=unclassified Nocardia TaxID=2637762 RepID=UPI0037B9CECB